MTHRIKNAPESKADRTFSRSISSKTYNFLVRHMLGSKVRDHQCGFKAFKRDAVLSLLDEVEAKHWFWDTEILVRAQRHGFNVKEIAVEWKSGKGTKVNLFNCGICSANNETLVKLKIRKK
jgi:hypothetical protein